MNVIIRNTRSALEFERLLLVFSGLYLFRLIVISRKKESFMGCMKRDIWVSGVNMIREFPLRFCLLERERERKKSKKERP